MDIDTIKRLIQKFFQDGTVTIVGSGLSLAEGIPGMNKLAKELQLRMPILLSEEDDIKNWESIESDLKQEIGLEEALHKTQPNEHVEACIRKVTASYIGDAEKKVLTDIIENGKELRFSEYLKRFNIRNDGITVITTNYDRLIEYACEINRIIADTLFVGKYIARYDPQKSKYSACIGQQKRHGKRAKLKYSSRVMVLKPHGCLSWHLLNDEPYSIPNCSVEDSLIITPGSNKYREGYSVPFDTHRSMANSEIDKAQRYIIIGYGFGDDHLETHLIKELRDGKPALIFTHSLSKKAENLIKQCKHITAFCYADCNGTKILSSEMEKPLELDGINLWDLHEMIKEVF